MFSSKRALGIVRFSLRTLLQVIPCQDLHIRIIDAATGELLRELVPDPRRDYQRTGRPPGPSPPPPANSSEGGPRPPDATPSPPAAPPPQPLNKHGPGPTNRRSGPRRCPETSHVGLTGFEPATP